MTTELAGSTRRLARILRILTVAFVVSVVSLIVVTWRWVSTSDQWNPLGPYPVQQIVNRNRIVHAGESVRSVGVKCVADSRNVQVTGVSQWQSLVPPGTVIPNGGGTATRYAAGNIPPHGIPHPDKTGCTTFTYENAIPPLVNARTLELCEQNGEAPVWRLTGSETPIRDHDTGVTRAWETEPFRIDCDAVR